MAQLQFLLCDLMLLACGFCTGTMKKAAYILLACLALAAVASAHSELQRCSLRQQCVLLAVFAKQTHCITRGQPVEDWSAMQLESTLSRQYCSYA